MQYFGTRLSENISRREPEGYLLCLNVPVARSGTQEYLPEELGLAPGSFSLGSGLVPVYRPEEEVFAPETIASFEGMPVTNDHPADGVDIENIRRLQMGHAHNVRRGSGAEADLLLADLIITDPRLIDLILGGKREISCGYTYELAEEGGQYIQRKIRGNHIAVVDAGRAGPRVSIRDHKYERSHCNMKKSLTRLLARMAKDGDVETVAEFIGEMIGETPEAEAVEKAAEAVETVAETVGEAPAQEPINIEVPENHQIVIDEEVFGGIIERLDRLIGLLTGENGEVGEQSAEAAETVSSGAENTGDEDPEGEEFSIEEIAEAVEEAIEAMQAEEGGDPEAAEEIAEAVESAMEAGASTTIEETKEQEEAEEDCGKPGYVSVADAMKAAAKAYAPLMKKMSSKQRKKMLVDMARMLHVQPNRESADGRKAAAALRGGAARFSDDAQDLGRRIMAARNPNYHG